MKSKWIKALCLSALLFAAAIGTDRLKAANEIAISDDSGRTCAQTLLGANTAKTETRLVTVDTTGALIVNPFAGTMPSTFQYVRYAVPPLTDSGTNLNPAAASTQALVSNEGTGEMRVMPGAAATAVKGIAIFASGTISFSDASITSIHVYNTTAATATVSILYVR